MVRSGAECPEERGICRRADQEEGQAGKNETGDGDPGQPHCHECCLVGILWTNPAKSGAIPDRRGEEC